MTPYQVYTKYIALKNHFTQKNYDYFTYGGKVRAKETSFEVRKDQGLGDATAVEGTLTQVGTGLKSFLDSTGNITDVMMTKLLNEDTFKQIAAGINHLTALKVDGDGDPTKVKESLTAIGTGLGNFLDGTDNLAGTFGAKLLSGDTLSTLATGLSDINKLDLDVSKFENIGTAVDTLM